MAKASISIGVDDATGQPASGPIGPYITADDDGTRPRRQKRSRITTDRNRKSAKSERRSSEGADDLAGRRKGPAQP